MCHTNDYCKDILEQLKTKQLHPVCVNLLYVQVSKDGNNLLLTLNIVSDLFHFYVPIISMFPISNLLVCPISMNRENIG